MQNNHKNTYILNEIPQNTYILNEIPHFKK